MEKLFWVPDVIVFNNWQTSILPFLLDKKQDSDSIFKNVKTVFYIHEIDSNYKFSNDINYLKEIRLRTLIQIMSQVIGVGN